MKIEDEQLLLYADDGPGAEFKGTLPVTGISVSLARAKNSSKGGGALYAFNTVDPTGAMVAWAAFSRDERSRWLRALKAHGAKLEPDAEEVARTDDEERQQQQSLLDRQDSSSIGASNLFDAADAPPTSPLRQVGSSGVSSSEMTDSTPLSTLFGERAPGQSWDSRPPSNSVDSWPSGPNTPVALPNVSARRLLDDSQHTFSETSSVDGGNHSSTRGGGGGGFSVVDADDNDHSGSRPGILRRGSSRGSSTRSLVVQNDDRTDGSILEHNHLSYSSSSREGGGAQSLGTMKTVRFDQSLSSKREDMAVSPSISSHIDSSPGSTRSVNTMSSASNSVSRGQAAGKRVVAQWLTKENHLGSGTFGSVYQGTYFNQKVAIKELIVQDLSSESTAEFEREAELHYHLRHSNVILLLCYNVDPSNGPTCMIMELAQCSLFDVLHRDAPLPGALRADGEEKLNVYTRLRILEDVASGLMFLHTLDIMHLDLKSLNLLLDRAGTVKIADFGLSVVKSEIEGSEGKAIGSLPYMAPELMVDEPVPDKCCDVYSFYVVIWEVVCGKQPHEGRSPAWIMRFASKRRKRLEIPKHVGCPERLEALMIRCAEFDPSLRPSMEACQRAISDVRADPIAPSLMRVELPENALFTCEVVVPDGIEVLDAPRAKLDDETLYAPLTLATNSSSEYSLRTIESDKTEDSGGFASIMEDGAEGCTPLSSESIKDVQLDGDLSRSLLEYGQKFYVEAHVAAANARDDGEDQVYLKLANKESYVAAFGPKGENYVKLVDSSIGAERLAVEARSRGIDAVVEGLLFHLATMHAEAVLRLLACIFEILSSPECEEAIASTPRARDEDEDSTRHTVAMSDAMQVKACRRVVASLDVFHNDAHIQLAGVSAVVNLALDSVGRTELAKYGACRAVVSALHFHGERTFELQRVCVEAVLNLLSDDANAPALKDAGATRALLLVVTELARDNSMDASRSSSVRRRERRMAARAWTSLARLASSEPKHSSETMLVSNYYVRTSGDVLRKPNIEADDVPILLREFNAARLAVSSAEDAARVAMDRGTGAIVSSLTRNANDEEDDSVVIVEEVGKEIAAAPATLPSAATATPGEADDDGRGALVLLSSLCHAIQAFATMPTSEGSPSLADALLDAGAAKMLETALRCALENSAMARRLQSHNTLSEADDLARRACAAIMALAAASTRARVLLGDAGVCEAAVDIARDICGKEIDSPRDEIGRLRYYAVGALSNLAFSAPCNKERLDNAGALQAIAACAEAASDDLEQQRLCCRAFCTLGTVEATDDEDDPRLLEDKHLAVVTQAMLSYEDAQLQHLGCAAIINLAAEPRHRRALGRVDACEAVTAALKAHPMDARVQEYGFRAAVYLARDDAENRDRFHAHGVRRLAASAANLFSGNPSVLSWAQRLQKEL